ncbi:FtsX-like permease family protein [Sorangium sp. So ce1000]|uniref:FtsX-like permease family protein n=1 Tax=Sorangium sp. So ce1000 TaxID=3133325 RepID=UPI003F6096A6
MTVGWLLAERKSAELADLLFAETVARHVAGRVLRIFLIQGAVLGLLGSFVGSALGALLSKLFEGLVRGPDGAAKFPVQLDLELFVLAIGVGLLAAVLPAQRSSRLDPASAMRNG